MKNALRISLLKELGLNRDNGAINISLLRSENALTNGEGNV